MYQDQAISKESYPAQTECEIEKSIPLFANVLDKLRYEVQNTNDLAKETSNYCNSLHLMSTSMNKSQSVPEKSPEPGVVGLIISEIKKLTEANYVLRDCVNHLRNVVGN